MPGSSSWMPYAPQGVKGFDDDESVVQMQSHFRYCIAKCYELRKEL